IKGAADGAGRVGDTFGDIISGAAKLIEDGLKDAKDAAEKWLKLIESGIRLGTDTFSKGYDVVAKGVDEVGDAASKFGTRLIAGETVSQKITDNSENAGKATTDPKAVSQQISSPAVSLAASSRIAAADIAKTPVAVSSRSISR